MMSVGPLTYQMGIEDMSDICLSEVQQNISESEAQNIVQRFIHTETSQILVPREEEVY